jgi:hypothetical protein
MTESVGNAEQAPDPHPEDPVENNPAPVGHPAHKVWEDATHEALEEVYRLNARMLGSYPPNPIELPFRTIELVVGKYQIWARRNLCIVRDANDARGYERWLDSYMQAWIESSGGRFPDFLPEFKVQLLRACNYWKGNAWAQVREFGKRSEASQPEGLATRATVANPEANQRGELTGSPAGTPYDVNNGQEQNAIPAQRMPATEEQPSAIPGGSGPPPTPPLGDIDPVQSAVPFRGIAEGAMDPFTFFKEPRPLGDNPHPPDSSLWHGFEQATHEAKRELNSLWSDYTRSNASMVSPSEVLALVLDARLKRLDIVADRMLRIAVAEEKTAQLYEEWLADLMRAEEKSVLDLVRDQIPYYGEFLNHEAFTQALLLRQQSYKEKCDSKVVRLIRARSAASAAAAAPPTTNHLQLLEEAIHHGGLNAPKLAEKIRALLKPRKGSRLKVDRTTVYRILQGHTKKPQPEVREALIKVLGLTGEGASIVRRGLGGAGAGQDFSE